MYNKQKFADFSGVLSCIEKTFPIPARFRAKLPRNIAELSRLLTNSRSARTLSYLNRPDLLSAYLYYFLPWNLYRLCLLLPSLDILLSAGDSIIDLGSGPLTFISALWISRPDLRKEPLEFLCIDRSGQALEAGKKFFDALSGGQSKWKIRLIKKNININRDIFELHNQQPRPKGTGSPYVASPEELHSGFNTLFKPLSTNKARLISAVNMFNELYESIPHSSANELKQFAANVSQFMHRQAAKNSFILTVEPGVPQSGKFISFLRDAFLEHACLPAAPCTHTAACPLSGGGKLKKWCHFSYAIAGKGEKKINSSCAPQELIQLSKAAGLPKDRLVYSYLLIKPFCKELKEKEKNAIRVISDSFPLTGGKTGRYGCCKDGLVLLRGIKEEMEKFSSGSITLNFRNTKYIDEKSGVAIMELI